jgi:hypothetical protein
MPIGFLVPIIENFVLGFSLYGRMLLAAGLFFGVVVAAILRRAFRLEWGATIAVALFVLVVFAFFIPVTTETVMIQSPH